MVRGKTPERRSRANHAEIAAILPKVVLGITVAIDDAIVLGADTIDCCPCVIENAARRGGIGCRIIAKQLESACFTVGKGRTRRRGRRRSGRGYGELRRRQCADYSGRANRLDGGIVHFQNAGIATGIAGHTCNGCRQ